MMMMGARAYIHRKGKKRNNMTDAPLTENDDVADRLLKNQKIFHFFVTRKIPVETSF
jgi:hypothetical protein